MSVLTWWAIPVGATFIAICIVFLAGHHPRRRVDESRRSVREFQQFRSALSQSNVSVSAKRAPRSRPVD